MFISNNQQKPSAQGLRANRTLFKQYKKMNKINKLKNQTNVKENLPETPQQPQAIVHNSNTATFRVGQSHHCQG
jgi:hypothetical protein